MKELQLVQATITCLCLFVSLGCYRKPATVAVAFHQQTEADMVVEYWTLSHFSISKPALADGRALKVFSDVTFTPLFPSLSLEKRSVVVVLDKRADPGGRCLVEVMAEAECYFRSLGFSTVLFQLAVSDDDPTGLPIVGRAKAE
ncbi:MAG: hypothetical protein GX456_07485 [Verrucomicrobia bacterium]|nr:hypothetical protein [Verrucomicrobiota bacterium]